jgi:hypothetical protein
MIAHLIVGVALGLICIACGVFCIWISEAF